MKFALYLRKTRMQLCAGFETIAIDQIFYKLSERSNSKSIVKQILQHAIRKDV